MLISLLIAISGFEYRHAVFSSYVMLSSSLIFVYFSAPFAVFFIVRNLAITRVLSQWLRKNCV